MTFVPSFRPQNMVSVTDMADLIAKVRMALDARHRRCSYLRVPTLRALGEEERLHKRCFVRDYFVTAIDLRKSTTLYEKNASPMIATIAKLGHAADSPPPR